MTLALPTTRDEDWRWADLGAARTLAAVAPPANDRLPGFLPPWLGPGARRWLFAGGERIDGEPTAAVAGAAAPAHALADLAAGADGVMLDIPAGTDGGAVEIAHVGTGGSAHGRTGIRLGAGSRLTVIEHLADVGAEHWLNHRFDADLAEGANLTHIIRAVNGAGLVTSRSFVRLSGSARLSQLLMGLSAAALRADSEVHLAGAGAHADVHGALIGGGSARQDALTRVRHVSPSATSDQKWRLLGGGRAAVSVSGGVEVARDAQGTAAEQSLKALLLARGAVANLKPELEIFADDVRCAHGCTVGALDRNALFYLESRGVAPAEARSLLTRAFVADVFAAIADQPLRDLLEGEAGTRLAAAASEA